MKLELFKQPDGSWVSEAATSSGAATVFIRGRSGRVHATSRLVVAGDVVIWDGESFGAGLTVFEEGHDPEQEMLADIA